MMSLCCQCSKCRFWVTLFIRASNHVEHEDPPIVETNFNVIISIESIIWMHVVIWSLVVSNLQRTLDYTIYSSCMCLKFQFEANHPLSGNKLHHNMLCFIYYIQHRTQNIFSFEGGFGKDFPQLYFLDWILLWHPYPLQA